MFLRSAKNAGFDVDVKLIDEALAYMGRLYDPNLRTFRYEINTDDPKFNFSRGMAGAGVLSLSLAETSYGSGPECGSLYLAATL
ncbi:MAG: hypothetical protein U0903_03955 [Planctomycetales bacterium]